MAVIVSPVVCRIEERKYLGLRFFLEVEQTHIRVMLGNCEEFQGLMAGHEARKGEGQKEGSDSGSKEDE